MMSRLRESLTLLLIAFLPFHALFVTAGTKFLRGAGQAPWGPLAVWKEGLLVVILLVAAIEILGNAKKALKIDLLDLLIGGLLVIGFAVSFYRPWMTDRSLLLGFKYDFIPLIAFAVLRRVPWSEHFRRRMAQVILTVAGIVAAYGIATFFAPTGFFRLLGYSDAHSLYIPSGSLAAFQQISGSAIRRIQSTLSGPNQLGIWLLIPLSILASGVSRKKMVSIGTTAFGCLLLAALFLTFSRSAWIATCVVAAAVAYALFPRRLVTEAIVAVASVLAIVAVAVSLLFPAIFLRSTSTWGHIVRPLAAIYEIRRYPLGQGLGSAGPAANRTHDPCVLLQRGADPSWAKAMPQLCVFVGDIQMQPTDRECRCALLPENWYLQIGVEMGVVGFILFLGVVALILRRLSRFPIRYPLLAFLGISVAALFLHAWEDSAVAYTGWLLAAVALSPALKKSQAAWSR